MKVELPSTLENHNCQQIGYIQAMFPMFKSFVCVCGGGSACLFFGSELII